MNISVKTVKPENCAMVFGIPTTKAQFFDNFRNSEKDFVRHFKGGWAQYYNQIVSNSDRILPVLSEFGVTVIQKIDPESFSKLFRESIYDVIILFSHWHNDTIELSDHLYNISNIVDAIPYEFNGILDLCVCHPENLTILLRRDRPNCLTRYTQQKATPYIWLHFYLVLFKNLMERELTYLQALEITIDAFLHNKGKS